MTQKVLSYDLGGTKLAAGVVNHRGRILDEIRVPALFAQGKDAVLEQLVTIGKTLLKQHPEIKHVGMASAGPVDMMNGILLDPTNFVSSQGTWGQVAITQFLSKKLKKKVFLENDAAAAVLAEHWIGTGKKCKNIMVLTLGTGLGTGVICNGELVRSGRFMHNEGGHIIIRQGDVTAPCGCGNLGCAEAFLSGKSFTHRARVRLKDPSLSAKDVADLARGGHPKALDAFTEYSELMAAAIHSYVRIYCPEIVVLTGSFANAADLFLERTQTLLNKMLVRVPDDIPKLAVSKLQNEASLVGGAYVAFHREGKRSKKS